MPIPDKIQTRTVNPSWKDSGFDKNLTRSNPAMVQQGTYIPGNQFNTQLGDLLFNRMIKLRNLPSGQFPQGTDPGKIFWDKDNKKYKLWVDTTSQWVDIVWTSTSTSTTSSSSSSTSTTTT